VKVPNSAITVIFPNNGVKGEYAYATQRDASYPVSFGSLGLSQSRFNLPGFGSIKGGVKSVAGQLNLDEKNPTVAFSGTSFVERIPHFPFDVDDEGNFSSFSLQPTELSLDRGTRSFYEAGTRNLYCRQMIRNGAVTGQSGKCAPEPTTKPSPEPAPSHDDDGLVALIIGGISASLFFMYIITVIYANMTGRQSSTDGDAQELISPPTTVQNSEV
jgi:hypothetical protein